MRAGKGDIRSQRARRRDRYRGCPVCGLRGAQCTECGLGKRLVTLHGPGKLTLVVDGSFVASSQDSGGHGGAGLVLIQGDKILVVYYLGLGRRGAGYALAHRLSIEGRCRLAPGTVPSLGVEFAADRVRYGRAGRRRMAAELLLERARRDPDFRGDFLAIAAQLGWTSGPRWQHNPAIRIASQLWLEQNDGRGPTVQKEGSQDP